MTAMLVSNETPERETETAAERGVARWVLQQLGQPGDLLKVEVKKLWGQNFRVNVFTATETQRALPTIQIPDSFFVTVCDDGYVSRPGIERKYSSSPAMGA